MHDKPHRGQKRLSQIINSILTVLSHQILLAISIIRKPSYQFAFLEISSLIPKLLHLFDHRSSLPIVLFLLYLPTFFVQDVAVLVGAYFLFSQNERSRQSLFRLCLKAVAITFTACTSAAQLSFYFGTGGEVPWTVVVSHATDTDGIRLVMSGLPTFCGALATYSALALLLTPEFFNILTRSRRDIITLFTMLTNRPWLASVRNHRCASQVEDVTLEEAMPSGKTSTLPRAWSFSSVLIVVFMISTIPLQLVRPRSMPYSHLSGTLPLSVIEAFIFAPVNAEFCRIYPPQENDFPFESLLPNATSMGRRPLSPQKNRCSGRRSCDGSKNSPWTEESRTQPKDGHGNRQHSQFPKATVGRTREDALTEQRHRASNSPPQSAEGYMDSQHYGRPNDTGGETTKYFPDQDPLKVSNLEQKILDKLEPGFKTDEPYIRHVLLITMESTRKDVFPLEKGSRIYEKILASRDSSRSDLELDYDLARLTPTAELLTGQTSAFNLSVSLRNPKAWHRSFNNTFGGINAHGAITKSSFTLKSILASHCGVEPLPVDFTEETNARIYQPCLPQILDKLNQQENNVSSNNAARSKDKSDASWLKFPWHSVLMQSVTDLFDSQDVLNAHMGFREILAKSEIADPSSKYFPPSEPQSNYFGYPESEILPYLRDRFLDGEENNERLFLSILTSTTHHPFKTPAGWGKDKRYFPKSRMRTNDEFNGYLNTVAYQDEWLDNVFEMLDETGVLNNTLVVLAADHGLAFDAMDNSKSAYENGHRSNFDIPLLFLNPHLPRIQVEAQVTQLSILPTILDLLVQTKSLNQHDTEIVSSLLPQYQGQSMIRKFIPSLDDRPVWNFGIINPGGSMLAISSAITHWRLIMPLCSCTLLRFTDTENDPTEEHPITEWTSGRLVEQVRAIHGEEAADWVIEAQQLGRWWFWEQRRRWDYHMAAKSTDRDAGGSTGGHTKKEHWWET